MTGLADQVPPATDALSKAEKLEQLRRKMASIPARSDGTEPATPSVMLRPVDAREPTPIVATAQSTLRMLHVPKPIGDLLPRGGLARGTVVSVDGALSVLLSLLASVTGSGKHAAIIGLPKLGLLAATEMGADLARCALIPAPGPAAIDVAAILLDGMDLVVLGLAGAAVPPTRARAVVARARSVDRTIARHAYVHDSAAPNEAVDISGAEGGVGSVRKCGSQDRGFGGGPLGPRGAS
ncbi:hypothetical protein ACFWNH_29040 [Rhodococcus qingshengii]|uniref:hypothetical protein n=1 Tax=Rhodococcus qingshengii TaxID=334542 RepID=UPI003650EDFB